MALIGREAFSGSSLKLAAQHAHRVEAGPDVVARALGAAAQHALAPGRAGCARSPQTIASVPVLQALELVVTWLPSASRPETRAEMPLAITCSTTVLPRRRTFLASVSGTTLLADRVHAADAGAEDRARVPVDASSSRLGRSRPASRPGLDGRERRVSGGSSSSRSSSSVAKYRSASSSTPCGHAGDLAAELELDHASGCDECPSALAQRELERLRAVAVGRDDAQAGHHHPTAVAHCGTPIPESVAEQTTVPSARVISTSERSLLRRKNTFRGRDGHPVPGRTTPENSTSASVNSVTVRSTSSVEWS